MEHKTDHSKDEPDRDRHSRRERRGDRKGSGEDKRPRRSDRIEGRRSRNPTDQNSNPEKTDVPNTQRNRFVAFLSMLPFNTSAHDIVQLFYACKILSVSLHFPIDKMEPLNHMKNEHGDLVVASDQKACIGTGVVEFSDYKSLRDVRYCGTRIRDQPIGINVEVYWAAGSKAEQDGTEYDTVPSDTHSERRREHRRREPREHHIRDGVGSSGRRTRRRDNTAHKQGGPGENKTPANDHSHDDSDDSASDSSYESIEAQEARYRFESQFHNDNDEYQDGDFMYHV